MKLKLRKVDWLFVLFAVAVVAGVSMLPTPKDRNPMIPKSAEHLTLTNEKDCVRCHQVDGVKPVPARHPKRQDCFRCHARSST
jgi:cytochrome c553